MCKILIEDLVLAKAYADAVQKEIPRDSLTAPRPLHQSIGIAIGLFILLVVSGNFATHAKQRVGLLGLRMRAAVSSIDIKPMLC